MSEQIGDAHVDVALDGDGPLARRARKRLEREWEKSGEAAGEKYMRGLDKAAAAEQKKSAARIKGLFASQTWSKIGREAGEALGSSAGDRAVRELRSRIERGKFRLPEMDSKNLARSLGDLERRLGVELESISREITSKTKKALDDQLRAEADFGKKLVGERTKVNLEIIKGLRERNAEQTRLENEQAKLFTRLQKEHLARLMSEESEHTKAVAAQRTKMNLEIVKGLRERAVAEQKIREDQTKLMARLQGEEERDMLASYKRLRDAHSRMVAGNVRDDEDYHKSIERTQLHLAELRDRINAMPSFQAGRGGVRREIESDMVVMERNLTRIVPQLHLFNRRMDTTGTTIGRVFGRGSRSDIVNLFGAMAEGGFRVATMLPRMAEGAIGFGQAFVTNLKAGQGVMSALGKTVSGGAGGMAKFGAAMTAAAVAIPVVVLVVGTLVAAMSMLLGVVTALAASLTFALGGALVAVVGLLGPVAAGIGVLVAAVQSMSDAQKAAVKSAIGPFVAGMKDIGRAAADAIFGGERFTKTIKDMTAGLASGEMKGLVVAIADAIGDVGAGWAESLNSDGFRRWLEAMGRTVPDQIRNLGATARNVLGGLGGFFLAAQPFISDFTQWLERISARFSEWANSADGREEIVRFLERAKESAKAVGGFLGEIVGLLADVFDAGKDTGDGIFADMEKGIANFRNYIADGGLEQWFKDTKRFAEDLGGVIKTLGGILDSLDSPGARTFLSALMTGFQALSVVMGGVALGVAVMRDTISAAFGAILATVGGVMEGIGAAGTLLAKIPGVPDSFGSSLKNAGRDLRETGEDMMSFKNTADVVSSAFNANAQNMGASASGAKEKVSLLKTVLDGVPQRTDAAVTTPGVENATFQVGTLGHALGGLLRPWVAPVDAPNAPAAQGKVMSLLDVLRVTTGTAWLADVSTPNAPAAKGQVDSLFTALTSTTSRSWDAAVAAPGASPSTTLVQGLHNALGGVVRDWRATVSVNDQASYKIGGILGQLASVNKTFTAHLRIATGMNVAGASGGMVVGPGMLATSRKMASGGGIAYSQQKHNGVTIGEAGAELIVPLRRPLHMVDPLVRPLSAIAQGMAGMPSNSKPEKKIDASGWTIVTGADPKVAASEIINRVVGVDL